MLDKANAPEHLSSAAKDRWALRNQLMVVQLVDYNRGSAKFSNDLVSLADSLKGVPAVASEVARMTNLGRMASARRAAQRTNGARASMIQRTIADSVDITIAVTDLTELTADTINDNSTRSANIQSAASNLKSQFPNDDNFERIVDQSAGDLDSAAIVFEAVAMQAWIDYEWTPVWSVIGCDRTFPSVVECPGCKAMGRLIAYGAGTSVLQELMFNVYADGTDLRNAAIGGALFGATLGGAGQSWKWAASTRWGQAVGNFVQSAVSDLLSWVF